MVDRDAIRDEKVQRGEVPEIAQLCACLGEYYSPVEVVPNLDCIYTGDAAPGGVYVLVTGSAGIDDSNRLGLHLRLLAVGGNLGRMDWVHIHSVLASQRAGIISDIEMDIMGNPSYPGAEIADFIFTLDANERFPAGFVAELEPIARVTIDVTTHGGNAQVGEEAAAVDIEVEP